ncbi:unnamed protein product, partial [Schistosoma rodhaini]
RTAVEIYIDKKWIKSGTLGEYEVSGDCPKHNSIKTCQSSRTSDACFWCEKANTCIVSNDNNIHDLKVIGCQNN